MKRRTFSILALGSAFGWTALAAGIDGKWVAKVDMPAGKKSGSGGPVEVTFDLKSDGNKLTGSVSGLGGRRAGPMSIEEGKIEGNKFSFKTVQKSRRGERKIVWEGMVEGDELKGTRAPEGGRRSVPFTAKRQ